MSRSADMLRRAARRFAREDRGAVTFEAIWVGLFLTFMIAPTLYVYQTSITRLDGSWMQRLATRQDATMGACNGLFILPLPFVADTGVNSVNTVNCDSVDTAEPRDELLWPVLDDAVSGHFPNLLDDMKNEGGFQVHRSQLRTVDTARLELGQNEDGFGLIDAAIDTIGAVLQPAEAYAPATEYYRWDDEVWRRGHDAVIWDSFSSDAQKMFPNVFPSR